MKILLINVTYGIGSTGKIVKCMQDEYIDLGHQCKVLVGRKSSLNNENIIKVTSEFESKIHHAFSKITGNLYGGMYFSTNRILRCIKKEKPDIVHLHCVNGYFVNIYRLLNFLKKNKIKCVITNHADFMFTANCGCAINCQKWETCGCNKCDRVHEFNSKLSLDLTSHYFKKMKNCFENFNNLIITNVSDWLTLRSSKSIIQKPVETNKTILNPIKASDFSNFEHNPYPNNKKNVFYCTPDFNNAEKGGTNLFKVAELMPDVDFWVKSSISPLLNIDLPNVHFISEDISLKNYYHFADASIILSKIETFSMVVAESLFCGTPVVGFKCGGPETIALNDYSCFVEQGDYKSFASALRKAFLLKDKSEEIIGLANDKYNSSIIAHQYLELYKSLLGNN